MSDFHEQLKIARKNQIIESAIVVIAEKGFQRTTIKDIAQNAGIADGTIYNYFANKEALLFSIMERLTEAEMRETHFAEAEEMPFNQFIGDYIGRRMKEIDGNFQIFKAILPELIVNSDLSRQLNERLYDPAFAAAENYIQKLMDDGKLPSNNPAFIARLLAAPIFGLLLLRLFGDDHVTNNWENYSAAVGQLIAALNDQ